MVFLKRNSNHVISIASLPSGWRRRTLNWGDTGCHMSSSLISCPPHLSPNISCSDQAKWLAIHQMSCAALSLLMFIQTTPHFHYFLVSVLFTRFISLYTQFNSDIIFSVKASLNTFCVVQLSRFGRRVCFTVLTLDCNLMLSSPPPSSGL